MDFYAFMEQQKGLDDIYHTPFFEVAEELRKLRAEIAAIKAVCPETDGLKEAMWALKEIRRLHKGEPWERDEAEFGTLYQTVAGVVGGALKSCGIPEEG